MPKSERKPTLTPERLIPCGKNQYVMYKESKATGIDLEYRIIPQKMIASQEYNNIPT